jgi:hypothetical protein
VSVALLVLVALFPGVAIWAVATSAWVVGSMTASALRSLARRLVLVLSILAAFLLRASASTAYTLGLLLVRLVLPVVLSALVPLTRRWVCGLLLISAHCLGWAGIELMHLV